MELNYVYTFLVWSANFIGAVFSALLGAILASKIGKRMPFLLFWIALGIFSSLLLMLTNNPSGLNILILATLYGISFGLGMPACLGYYSDSTIVENRARLGGIIMFITTAGTIILLGVVLTVNNVFMHALILAAWRGTSLAVFPLSKQQENIKKGKNPSYLSIISQRAYLFYFIPWIMFSLVNSLSIPMQSAILGETSLEFLLLVEYTMVGSFAIIGGFLSDFFGRKRMIITGFVTLGIGYAILGIYPENVASWYLYTIVDGMAWGIFSAIFFITIWGDLAQEKPPDKYYALGGLPYLLSSFLRITLGPYIAQTIPAYAIFSFTAFFLFLAVIPLMYAPETLPEKKIKERELKGYIDKAKKVKEKYT